MPGRTLSGAEGKGRYGFNGKERDKDMHSLTAYDYGFRIYNPAIGKFLSVDPLTQTYPELTPYQFASNSPIEAVDLDGLEAISSKDAYISLDFKYSPETKQLTSIQVYAHASSPNIPVWIANNIRKHQASETSKANQSCGCKLFSAPAAMVVANLSFNFEAPSEETSEELKALADESRALSGKSGTFVDYPKSRFVTREDKARLAEYRSLAKENPMAVRETRLVKAAAGIEVLTLGAKIFAYFKRSDQITAFNTQIFRTSAVVSLLQDGIDGTLKGVHIPEVFRNDSDLEDIANYVLTGAIIYEYSTDPQGNHIKKEKTAVMNVAKSLLNVYNQRQQKIKDDIKDRLKGSQQKIQTDNTGHKPVVQF